MDTLHNDLSTFMTISCWILFGMISFFRQKLYIKSKHITHSKTFSKKQATARRATHNTAHAICILDSKGNRHDLSICNTYCLSLATTVTQQQSHKNSHTTTVTQEHLKATSHVCCLSCFLQISTNLSCKTFTNLLIWHSIKSFQHQNKRVVTTVMGTGMPHIPIQVCPHIPIQYLWFQLSAVYHALKKNLKVT
jgi:hypothetical protein